MHITKVISGIHSKNQPENLILVDQSHVLFPYVDKPNELMERLKKEKEYVLTKGDTVHLVSGTNIPRFKLKKFCTENSCYNTIKPEKADIVFMDARSIKEVVSRHSYSRWHLGITKGKDLKPLKEEIRTTSEFISDRIAVLDAINRSEDEDFILINEWSFPNRIRENKEELSLIWKKTDSVICRDVPEFWKLVDIFENHSEKLYHSSQLLTLLGSEVIDAEKAKVVDKMLESRDINNQVLAMEMMANSDYEKSAFYILKIMMENSNVIRNSPIVNSINFKSMLEYFGLHKNQLLTLTAAKITSIMRELKLLNFNIMAKMKEYHEFNLIFESYLQVKEELDETLIEELNNSVVNDDQQNLYVYEEFNGEDINPVI